MIVLSLMVGNGKIQSSIISQLSIVKSLISFDLILFYDHVPAIDGE
jgi:hypothetical protein